MLTALAGDDFAVAVLFEQDGEPFVPDALGLTYALRGHDGSQLIAPTGLVNVTNSKVTITIPAARQTIAAGRWFEKRNLVVQGTVGGRPFTKVTPYRVITWLNYTVTPTQVRAFIGVDAGELPDSDIDLVSAHFALADRIGDAALSVALQSGGATEQLCNQAIVAQAVLDLFPSLTTRLSKKESDGNRQVERFTLDLAALRSAAMRAIDQAVTAVSGTDIVVSPALIAVTNRTDPFTGE